MTTPEERISRLEGAYEHLATKTDLQSLETRLIGQLGDSNAEITKQMGNSETHLTGPDWSDG
jgi:hypothetical protein